MTLIIQPAKAGWFVVIVSPQIAFGVIYIKARWAFHAC